MNAEEMMSLYCETEKINIPSYTAWAFGTDTDGLAQLVHTGKKTATSSLYEMYLHDGVPLPQAGEYSVILNGRNEAVCIIRTTSVYISAFSKVAPFFAAKEGEGDLTLAYWRKVHEAFFTEELKKIGKTFSKTVSVVCEEFELLYPKEREKT